MEKKTAKKTNNNKIVVNEETSLKARDESLKIKNEDDVSLFDGDYGLGFEDFDSKSIAIPFLLVLQPLSPMLEELEDAKPGMIADTIDRKAQKSVLVVPCAFQRKYVAWIPRSEGGGFKGEYDAGRVDSGEIEYTDGPNGEKFIGNAELKDTRNHYVLYFDGNEWKQALISMSSTQIKRSKRWNSQMSSQTINTTKGQMFLPMWGCMYELTSEKEENDKGKWYSWVITKKEIVKDKNIVNMAKDFYISIKKGKQKVDYSSIDESKTIDDDDDEKF